MADEHQFIENGLQRSQIDEFFQEELGRAGYGGMDVAKTPMGTQIVLKAEKPGWSSAKAARTSGRSADSRGEVQPRGPPDRRAGGRRTRPQRTNRRGPTGQRARAWLVLPEGRSHDDRPDHGRRRARRENRPVGEGHRRTIARREVQPRLHQSTTASPPRRSSTTARASRS